MPIDPASVTWPAIIATFGKPVELPSGEQIFGVLRRNGQLLLHPDDLDTDIQPGETLTIAGETHRILHITPASLAYPRVVVRLASDPKDSP